MASRKNLELKDRKNILYVALTRAVEGMIVIRKEKDSVFDEVGMQTMTLGRLEIEQPVEEREKSVSHKASVTLHHYGVQEVLKQEEEEEKDYAAILFGTALHYTLEMVGSFDGKGLDDAISSLQNRYGHSLGSDQVREIRRRIERLMRDERFSSLLPDAVVSKERPLSFGGEIKQVDLLLEYEDQCIVIDYKSSQKHRHKHQMQVSMYKKAIESITNKTPSGMIVYLLEEGIAIEEV
jgi:exodeoxyribonuclease V beta subunit